MCLESIIVVCINFSLMLLKYFSYSPEHVPYRSQEEEWQEQEQEQELRGGVLTCFKNSSKFSFSV